jgi:hypothetical protein
MNFVFSISYGDPEKPSWSFRQYSAHRLLTLRCERERASKGAPALHPSFEAPA